MCILVSDLECVGLSAGLKIGTRTPALCNQNLLSRTDVITREAQGSAGRMHKLGLPSGAAYHMSNTGE
jgi:hypothetical protein